MRNSSIGLVRKLSYRAFLSDNTTVIFEYTTLFYLSEFSIILKDVVHVGRLNYYYYLHSDFKFLQE